MELAKDDLELTLKELKGQQTQMQMSLTIVQLGIKGLEKKIAAMKDDKPKKTPDIRSLPQSS